VDVQVQNWIFTAVGATVLYSTWGREKLRPFMLSDLIDTLHLEDRLRIWVEFIVFIMLGTVVAVAFTQPVSKAQAISAGLGWTGLVFRPSRSVGKGVQR
jgi:hypothetical protein